MDKINDVFSKLRHTKKPLQIKRFLYQYKMKTALHVFANIGRTFDPDFQIKEVNRGVYENLIMWVHGDPNFWAIDPKTNEKIKGDLTKGIYLAGCTGSGKSLALEILSEYSKIDEVKFDIGDRLCKIEYECFRTESICSEYSEYGKLQKFKKKRTICFQDLATDAEPIESLHMGNRQRVMQSILEHRGDERGMITLISSNIPIDHRIIKERYSDRVVSRLGGMCNYFILNGIDWRQR